MYVFATSTCAVGWNGGVVRLQAGDAWPADDPFVKARSEFFKKDPPVIRSTGPAEARVESATARPGERRGGTRGR